MLLLLLIGASILLAIGGVSLLARLAKGVERSTRPDHMTVTDYLGAVGGIGLIIYWVA